MSEIQKRDRIQPQTIQHAPATERRDADGDFRGPYGYGRPSHKADPNATYVFQPGPPRALPPRRASGPSAPAPSAPSFVR